MVRGVRLSLTYGLKTFPVADLFVLVEVSISLAFEPASEAVAIADVLIYLRREER